MKGNRLVTALVVAVSLCVLVFAGLSFAVPNIPEVDGTAWMKSTDQEKLAFLVGAGSVVAIEHHIDLKKADDSSKFTMGWITAFKDQKWSEIASRIDAYYSTHPDQNGRLVMDVVWKELILPTLKDKEGNP